MMDIKRILIIEPDSRVTNEYLSFFRNNDYDMDTTSCITKAVERIENVHFDCIIMDVNLPEMKGYEAVKILKTIDPKIQVIITAAENT
ncbi:MAG: response regulator, partial [Deltaproteobacteria bacterium]|nr:response regulator [Deltaproteobacteria bacterium]